jgi:transposase
VATKKELKLLTELLGIEGMRVESQRQYEGIGIILQVEAIKKESTCHRCGTKSSSLHQNNRYIVKDLQWGEQQVNLEINRRQFKCKKCQKPFSEQLEFVKGRRTYTSRLAKKILTEVLEGDIQSVARTGVVTTAEIERIIEDGAAEIKGEIPTGLRKLGIDEIAMVKGQGKYCAVLVDIERGKLLAIIESRQSEEIEKVLKGWGEEVLERIEEVSIDLWKGYKSLAIKMIPNAQVVADRFHVAMQINSELDKLRKQEKREIEAKLKIAKTVEERANYNQRLAVIKSSKYALLKNERELKTEQEQEKLKQVRAEFSKISAAHMLKEKWREIMEKTTSWMRGLLKIRHWLVRAKQHLPNSCGTISRWLTEIVAYFDERTTSGVVEGINNKIKLIKRTAYGFTNFNNFRSRCLLNWRLNY